MVSQCDAQHRGEPTDQLESFGDQHHLSDKAAGYAAWAQSGSKRTQTAKPLPWGNSPATLNDDQKQGFQNQQNHQSVQHMVSGVSRRMIEFQFD